MNLPYVTYLTENLITPLSYEINRIKVDTLNIEGNLVLLLKAKGNYCNEIIVKVSKKNSIKEYIDEYCFYLFDDSSLALLSDFSLHYFRKISSKNIARWPSNNFDQVVIKGPLSSFLSIQKSSKKFISFVCIPPLNGSNNFHLESILNSTNKFISRKTLFKELDKFNKDIKSFIISNDSNVIRYEIFVGSSSNELNDFWELRYKYIDRAGRVIVPMSNIYKSIGSQSDSFLIKGNEVEIVSDFGDFYKIRFYGKNNFECWIKKNDIIELK